MSEFNLSLCWSTAESSNLRSGNEFPSWSWLAWIGRSILRYYGPLTQVALVDFCRVRSNTSKEQELVLISHDLSQKDRSDTLSIRDLAVNVRPKLRDDFHIVFWAEAALRNVLGNRLQTHPQLESPECEDDTSYVESGGRYSNGVHEFVLI